MTQRNPAFEVRPSVITGDTADVYLHRTQRVLRNEGINPTVVMEFSAATEGTLCGSMEVRAVLSKVTSEGNREVWSVEEGQQITRGEVCLQVRAPYSSFGLYETAICGILAHHSGWATAAHQLTEEAGTIPVVNVGAHNVHPSVAPVMDYAAVVGGCLSGSTVLGSRLANSPPVATVSGALVQLMGNPVKAMGAFDQAVPPDVQRIAYMDPRKDPAEQAVEVARAMRDHLNSVRIARVPGGGAVGTETLSEVRSKLDAIGARHVSIVLSGRLTPEGIRKYLDEGAPIDVFHDNGYISSANPLSFLPNIVTISDKPVPQETELQPPNARLVRVL